MSTQEWRASTKHLKVSKNASRGKPKGVFKGFSVTLYSWSFIVGISQVQLLVRTTSVRSLLSGPVWMRASRSSSMQPRAPGGSKWARPGRSIRLDQARSGSMFWQFKNWSDRPTTRETTFLTQYNTQHDTRCSLCNNVKCIFKFWCALPWRFQRFGLKCTKLVANTSTRAGGAEGSANSAKYAASSCSCCWGEPDWAGKSSNLQWQVSSYCSLKLQIMSWQTFTPFSSFQTLVQSQLLSSRDYLCRWSGIYGDSFCTFCQPVTRSLLLTTGSATVSACCRELLRLSKRQRQSWFKHVHKGNLPVSSQRLPRRDRRFQISWIFEMLLFQVLKKLNTASNDQFFFRWWWNASCISIVGLSAGCRV